ncbi:MAG: glutaredoxin 3 [Alphaproteobacteria bacterium]|jgi:glutaredoxin 3
MSIIVYSKPTCPYCVKATNLLTSLGQKFTVIDIAAQPEKRDEMIQKSGGSYTVPQIFIGSKHIGGCDDLHALHSVGKLTELF